MNASARNITSEFVANAARKGLVMWKTAVPNAIAIKSDLIRIVAILLAANVNANPEFSENIVTFVPLDILVFLNLAVVVSH